MADSKARKDYCWKTKSVTITFKLFPYVLICSYGLLLLKIEVNKQFKAKISEQSFLNLLGCLKQKDPLKNIWFFAHFKECRFCIFPRRMVNNMCAPYVNIGFIILFFCKKNLKFRRMQKLKTSRWTWILIFTFLINAKGWMQQSFEGIDLICFNSESLANLDVN